MKHGHKHDTNMLTLVVTYENDITECNHMCQYLAYKYFIRKWSDNYIINNM